MGLTVRGINLGGGGGCLVSNVESQYWGGGGSTTGMQHRPTDCMCPTHEETIESYEK
jgi:hypothetical protein